MCSVVLDDHIQYTYTLTRKPLTLKSRRGMLSLPKGAAASTWGAASPPPGGLNPIP